MADMPSLRFVTADGESRPIVDIRLKPRKWDGTHCEHFEVEVSESERTLTCIKCGASLDPLGFIVQWARKFENDKQYARKIHEWKLKTWQESQRENQAGVKSYKRMWELAEADAANMRMRALWVAQLLTEAADRFEGMGNLEFAVNLRNQCHDIAAFPKAFAEVGGPL